MTAGGRSTGRARQGDASLPHQIRLIASRHGGIVDVSCNCAAFVSVTEYGRDFRRRAIFGTVQRDDPAGTALRIYNEAVHAVTSPPFVPGSGGGVQVVYLLDDIREGDSSDG